jgi:hypothetical protein
MTIIQAQPLKQWQFNVARDSKGFIKKITVEAE